MSVSHGILERRLDQVLRNQLALIRAARFLVVHSPEISPQSVNSVKALSDRARETVELLSGDAE